MGACARATSAAVSAIRWPVPLSLPARTFSPPHEECPQGLPTGCTRSDRSCCSRPVTGWAAPQWVGARRVRPCCRPCRRGDPNRRRRSPGGYGSVAIAGGSITTSAAMEEGRDGSSCPAAAGANTIVLSLLTQAGDVGCVALSGTRPALSAPSSHGDSYAGEMPCARFATVAA